MPTISAGEFRKGMIFEMEGKPMLVVDFKHADRSLIPMHNHGHRRVQLQRR